VGIFGRKSTQEPRIRNPHTDADADSYAFRRSRTLTGSSSSNVKAAGESRAQIKSPRLKEHELKRHRNLLLTGLLGAVIAAAGLWWLVQQFSAGTLEIRSSTVLTQGTVDTAKYQRILNNYFAARPLERFRFVLRQDTLQAYVQREASEVAEISVDGNGNFGGHGVATLTFREPLVGWQIRDKTYFIDSQGVSFEKSYYGSPSVTVHDASGINPADGAIASSRFLAFLGRVVHGINSSGVGSVSKVTLPPGMTREVDINLSGKPYRLKLQMDREPTGQVADVVAMVRFLDSKQITPTYVDVRVPSKAFYR
jgi:hypothetical protein